MAENKKGFILYCDLIHTIEKMPDDKAGLLIKHILRYVNDHNPVTDDMIVDLVFEPIKQQLKRDLRKWEDFRIKQSENGKLGGRPKKSKEDKPLENNPNNPSLILESQKSLKVIVTDTVTDNDNVIYPIKKVEEMFFSEMSLIEYTCKEKQCSEKEAKKYLKRLAF
jgi:hypothetical protein